MNLRLFSLPFVAVLAVALLAEPLMAGGPGSNSKSKNGKVRVVNNSRHDDIWVIPVNPASIPVINSEADARAAGGKLIRKTKTETFTLVPGNYFFAYVSVSQSHDIVTNVGTTNTIAVTQGSTWRLDLSTNWTGAEHDAFILYGARQLK